MAAKLTPVEREEKATEAVALSARGMPDTLIAEELEISRNTVRRLRENEYAKRAEHRDQDKERHLAVYDAIQKAAWERFAGTDNRSLNASGYLNTIKAAEDSKVKITGAEAPFKVQDVNVEYEVVWNDDDESFADTTGREAAG